MKVEITEHIHQVICELSVEDELELNRAVFEKYAAIQPRTFINSRKKSIPYYTIITCEKQVALEANYYIGVDWLIQNEKYVYVAPKINTKILSKFQEECDKEEEQRELYAETICGKDDIELNYLKMFLLATSHPEILNYTEGLLHIDWEAPQISIEQKEDILTPFLVVQFLNLLKMIVRKGLKRSYYKKEESLHGRVKGKILISQNIKHNVLKNRLTKTVCQYQEFGVDGIENRMLKKVLEFVVNYIANHRELFQDTADAVQQTINYCRPAFEYVSSKVKDYELKHIRTNAFYGQYIEAIKIGEYILKRFSYNISNTVSTKVKTPPFWIDMPRLFELYVYHQLLTQFESREIHYQYSTYGNELDFLINSGDTKMIIDAKYKLHYKNGQVHNDIRQVSGYARLKKVYKELALEDSSELVDCLIIYPLINELAEDYEIDLEQKEELKAYRKVFKLGVPLPHIYH